MNPGLLHLVTAGRFRRLQSVQGAETFDYEPVFRKLLEGSGEVIEQVRNRHERAQRLAASLLAVPPRKRLQKLKDPKYQSTDLLALLLHESEWQQLTDPRQALELASLAVALAHQTGAEGSATLPWALCLEINARRLLGNPGSSRRQEDALDRAAKQLDSEPIERACYCRTAALVRWEEGRVDEAAALLKYADAVFRESEEDEDRSTCAALLGLLLFEDGLWVDSSQDLYRGWSQMDRDRRPLLALRVGLALTVCLGEAKQDKAARCILEETRKLYSTTTPAEEMLRLYWREALALAALQEYGEAEMLLRSVLERLREEKSFAEAALVKLDLFGVLVESGREVPRPNLGSDLGHVSERVSTVLQVFHHWLEPLAAECPQELRKEVRFLRADLLREFRRCGHRIKPLPFA